MTANQRRPGFRLPWSSEMDAEDGEAASGSEEQPMTPTAASDDQAAQPTAQEAPAQPSGEAPATEATEHAAEPAAEMETPAVAAGADRAPAASEATPPAPTTAAAAPATPTEPDEFMRDLVDAMRRVAEEARDTGMAELRSRADERVRLLEGDAERRQQELRDRTEKDVAQVGEWERAEHERVKKEAEQRIAARRAQLDQQLAADATRTEAEAKAVRDHVAEYERQLEAYHSHLLEISDPAAFAAAAKRMPKAPSLDGVAAATTATTESSNAAAAPAPAPAAEQQATVEPASAASNGVPEAASEVHPAEEEVLAARLAQLDATLPPAAGVTPAAQQPASPAAPAPATAAEPATTEVVVKGLGSFGAITGFRQALSGVDGIDAVALSLGQTGEFVFRATHAAGFDVRGAIAQLEGDGAKIEERPEGGLRVTLDRAR
jgi:hypothetical protein